MITFSEKAIKYYNQKFDEFLLLLKPAPKENLLPNKDSSIRHLPSRKLTDDEVKTFHYTGKIDISGKRHSKYFTYKDQQIGLQEGDYEVFDGLIYKMSQRKEIYNFLSKKYLLEKAFEWFKNRYSGQFKQEMTFFDFLISESKNSIKTRKVCIPIDFLSIEKAFELGKVKFSFFSKTLFDVIHDEKLQKTESDEKTVSNEIEELREEYQGKVYSEIIVTAEQEKCIEIAQSETDRSLTILKCFSPTVFLPSAPSYFGRMGQVNAPQSHFLIFENNKLEVLIKQGDNSFRFDWPIYDSLLQDLQKDGLHDASELLKKESPSNLEDILLNCFYLFSKCISATEFQDKLVYALVTLETLLLKNSSEPIQSNLGLRLVFLVAKDFGSRKYIKNLINEAYGVRSSYLHHGKNKSETKSLQEIQRLVWFALRNILYYCKHLRTQDELLNFIEEKILT